MDLSRQTQLANILGSESSVSSAGVGIGASHRSIMRDEMDPSLDDEV